MMPTLVSLLAVLRDSLRTRVALQAEVLALRHQLLVLQRKKQKQRLWLSVADRIFWVWLFRVWADWRSALRIVKPETVIAWHRKGFRLLSLTKILCALLRVSFPKANREGQAVCRPARA
jgi:putative transposase